MDTIMPVTAGMTVSKSALALRAAREGAVAATMARTGDDWDGHACRNIRGMAGREGRADDSDCFDSDATGRAARTGG